MGYHFECVTPTQLARFLDSAGEVSSQLGFHGSLLPEMDGMPGDQVLILERMTEAHRLVEEQKEKGEPVKPTKVQCKLANAKRRENKRKAKVLKKLQNFTLDK